MQKHGVDVFGEARVTAWHVPRNTCCRHKPAPPLHDDKRVSNKPAHTPGHKSTWDHSDTNTVAPTLTLPVACTKRHITFSIGLEPPKRWFHKKPKSAETRGRRVTTKGVRGTAFPLCQS